MSKFLDKMKAQVKKLSKEREKIFYIKSGEKKRIRFLREFDKGEGAELVFHDAFKKNIGTVCKNEFNQKCNHCDCEDVRTRQFFSWPIFDYEANEVKILFYPYNGAYSPLADLMEIFEETGSLLDKDVVIKKRGTNQDVNFKATELEKSKFSKTQLDIPSNDELRLLIIEAFLEQDDVEAFKKYKSNVDDDIDNSKEENKDYYDMTAKELYKLCKERNIDAETKKKCEYYISLLEKNDSEGESQEDEEW